MADMQSEIRNELTQRIIPFWHGLRDEANGGFIGRVEFDLTRRPEADKGCILNSRILWFFSEAYMLLHEEALLEDARQFDVIKRLVTQSLSEVGSGDLGKLLGGHCLDVFAVEPFQFIVIKDGRRFADTVD